MLEAVVRQKANPWADVGEDLLTSSAFGLMKYLPVDPFWTALFAASPCASGQGNLLDHVREEAGHHGASLAQYTHVRLAFWPSHDVHKEPDILAALIGPEAPPLTFVIEVKLWSGKSDGEQDQLKRYLSALHDQAFVESVLGVRAARPVGLLYVTPYDAAADLEESRAACAGDPEGPPFVAHHLAWQDVLEVASFTSSQLSAPFDLMARDLAAFLKAMNLEHFKGFDRSIAEDMIPRPFYNWKK